MNVFVTGEVKSSEEAQSKVNQLMNEAEDRKKETENLKIALEQKRREAEEHTKVVDELKADLDGRKEELNKRAKELEEMKSQLNELNNLVEEKSKEADKSVDKYCSLMVKVHKLEETNDALTTRLEQFSARQHAHNNNSPFSSSEATQRRRSARKSSNRHPEEKVHTENVDPSPLRSSYGSSPGKRGHCDANDKDSAQEALLNLTKKIKASSATTPKPRSEQDDEEFRPEGLPELVQKGNHISFSIHSLLA